MDKYYYFHDCETSGLTTSHSVLKYYGCLLDKNLNLIKETPEYNIKPNSKSVLIDVNALQYNKIDIVKHCQNKNTITYDSFLNKMKKFFESSFLIEDSDTAGIYLNSKNTDIIICGHNVAFDNMFVLDDIRKQLDPFIVLKSKAPLDTATIAQYYKLVGKLPPELEISLENLSKYFKIDTKNIHSAKKDIQLTIDILKKFKELAQNKKEE